MGKKGLSQMDWVISLSIFILFLAWFFTFLLPRIQTAPRSGTLLDSMDRQFYSAHMSRIERIPVFVFSNSTGMKPVILYYPFMSRDVILKDHAYLFIGDNLVFLSNITSETRVEWLILGGNYSYGYENAIDITTEEDLISSENITVHFIGGLPASVYYKDNERVKGIEYFLGGEPFSTLTSTRGENKQIAFQAGSNLNLNHTSVVFAYNSEIHNFITLEGEDSSYIMNISMLLHTYKGYFSDNSHYGTFHYLNESSTVNYSYNYVTLFDDSEAISMFFGGIADFSFSDYNRTLSASISFPVSNNYIYSMILHGGNYSDLSIASVKLGAADKLEGIYLENLTLNYSELRDLFSLPSNMDFNIRIYVAGSLFMELGSTPGKTNVYSKTSRVHALTTEGELLPVAINYMIWSR